MADAATPSTADIVNDWFRERLACGELAQHTPAYNQAAAALPDLITRLSPAPAPAAAAAPAPAAAAAKTAAPDAPDAKAAAKP